VKVKTNGLCYKTQLGKLKQSADIRLFSKRFANPANAQLLAENPTLQHNSLQKSSNWNISITTKHFSTRRGTMSWQRSDILLAIYVNTITQHFINRYVCGLQQTQHDFMHHWSGLRLPVTLAKRACSPSVPGKQRNYVTDKWNLRGQGYGTKMLTQMLSINANLWPFIKKCLN